MSYAHLHLVMTHFPPVLSIAGAVAAASAVLFRRRRRDLVHLALLLMIITGAMMPAIYVAGLRTAATIGKVEGIQQEAIAPHQQAATITLWTCIVTALMACGLLIAEQLQAAAGSRLRLLVLLLAIGTASAIAWTADLGGAIHHPEIHS
jgi:hypothetical protein